MNKILKISDIESLSQIKNSGKKLVLVGGCFDILHSAHIEFLRKAKDEGDLLVVLLESDERIRMLKGKNRPVNHQKSRATVLSHLPFVDYVVMLQFMKSDLDYEILVKNLEPDIIALTAGNKVFDWERKYVEETGGRIIEVMSRMKDYSTTRIAQSIKL